MHQLSAQQGSDENGNGDAQEDQGVFSRGVPLGDKAVDPHIEKPGEDIAFEHASGKPAQHLGKALADTQTVQPQEKGGDHDRHPKAAVALGKAFGKAFVGG